MSTESTTGQQPWGAPTPPQEQPRARWSGRKTAIAVLVAVGIAAGGGVGIYAATANDNGNATGGRGGRGGGGSMGGGPGGAGLLREALHGEFVIADGSTELLQTGKVTAVSASSIALTSDDGYATTYTIDATTVVDNGRSAVTDLATGDEVTVIAKSGDTPTAVAIAEQGTGQQGVPPRRDDTGSGQTPPTG